MQYRYRLPSVVLSVINCPRYVDIFLFSLYCVVVIQIVICVLAFTPDWQCPGPYKIQPQVSSR